MSKRRSVQSRLQRVLLFIVLGSFFGARFASFFVEDLRLSVLMGLVLGGFGAAVYWFSDDDDDDASPRKEASSPRKKRKKRRDTGRVGADAMFGERPSTAQDRPLQEDEQLLAIKDAQLFSERAPHTPSSAGAVLRIVALSVAAGLLFFGFVLDEMETAFALGGGLGGLVGSIAALIYWWYRAFPRRRISILVGADGVRVGGAVVRYADIEEVRLEGAESSDSYVKTLVLVRRKRPSVRVASLYFPLLSVTEADNVRQQELVAAIEEGLSAWLARRENADRTAEQLLSRGESAPSEWLTRLRALGSGATATYRDAALSRDALTRLLASPTVKPSMRAAAAIALRAAEPIESQKGLRIGSGAFVDEKLRVAAGVVESASNDEALLEALEALETAERRVWIPRPERE